MPAVTRQKAPPFHALASAGQLCARPGDPATDCPGRPADPPPYARRCAPPGRRWPGSSRMRSGLTFPQPFGPYVTVLHGPCDPGNPCAAPRNGCGLPRSHGPAKGRVNVAKVKRSLLLCRSALLCSASAPTDLSILRCVALSPDLCLDVRMRGGPDRTCRRRPALDVVGGDSMAGPQVGTDVADPGPFRRSRRREGPGRGGTGIAINSRFFVGPAAATGQKVGDRHGD
jgi:hypothetical protein